VIDQPTSFLALAQLLSNLVSNSPFKPGVTLAQYAADLLRTRMVGENEGTVTLQTTGGYAVKTGWRMDRRTVINIGEGDDDRLSQPNDVLGLARHRPRSTPRATWTSRRDARSSTRSNAGRRSRS
jgi:hypothetical protein